MEKIIYSSQFDVSKSNGPGVNEREFISALDRIGKQKDLLYILTSPQNLSQISEIKHAQVTFCKPYSVQPWKWLAHQRSLYRLLKKSYTPDAFYVFRCSVFPISFFAFIKKFKPKYAIKTAGNGKFSIIDKKGGVMRVFKWLNKYMFSFILKNALAVDAVSPDHLKSLKRIMRLSGKNLLHIDNAVNIERFHPIPKLEALSAVGMGRWSNYFIIGYTGNFPLVRGGYEIIKTLPLLKARYGDRFKGLITGDDSGVETLKRVAIEEGVANDIVFTGRVPYDQMVKYVNSLDIGVSFLPPEHRGASEQKVRQYIACGKPVLVTPGSSSFVSKVGIGKVVEHDDFEKISELIGCYFSMPKKEYLAICEKSRDYALNSLSVDSALVKRMNFWKEKYEQIN